MSHRCVTFRFAQGPMEDITLSPHRDSSCHSLSSTACCQDSGDSAAVEQQSEGEGSLLTSRVSQYSSESAFGSADEAEPAELTMFKSAEFIPESIWLGQASVCGAIWPR